MLTAVDSKDGGAPALPRLQRAQGHARISFLTRDGQTCLDRLYQDGCAKVRLPRVGGAAREAVLINTAGGLTGGDVYRTEVDVQAGARVVMTTPACERIYRSLGGVAEVSGVMGIGAGARLDWLPQETILYDGGRLSRRLDADLVVGAELLAVEAVLFGRLAMGESVMSGTFRDRWRIRRAGQLLWADDLRFEGDIACQLARPAVLAGCLAMATVLFVGEAPERLLDPVRAAIGDAGGASAWDGKLVARLVAPDGFALRATLIPVIAVLMAGRPLPKVWTL